MFLSDIKPDLAEQIYKIFAKDCVSRFRIAWLAWLNRLLWMDTRDFQWVDNMKRKHKDLPPCAIIPKEEVKWHNLTGYTLEETMRGHHPSREDYEWILEESVQEDMLSSNDVDLAKKFLAERGIPWDKVLDYREDAEMVENGGWEDEDEMEIDTVAQTPLSAGSAHSNKASRLSK
ncbi:MAG: hypothetical protein ACRYGR_08235 [Janthinobacterium lividum]